MYPYDQQNPGQPQAVRNQNDSEDMDECRIRGVVMPRSLNMQDPIRFFPFPNGGGAIHIMVQVQKVTGTDPQTGQPRIRRKYIPVNIVTNKKITQQQLQSITPGMRVRIVGEMEYKSFTSKKTGEKNGGTEVNAFVCEILGPAQPVMHPYPGQQAPMPAYGQAAPVQPGPQYVPGQQHPYMGPQYGPAPAQAPVQAQPAYGQGYAPYGQQMPQQQQAPVQAQPHPAAPPYYQPPQQAPGAPEDLPEGNIPVKPINF